MLYRRCRTVPVDVVIGVIGVGVDSRKGLLLGTEDGLFDGDDVFA